MMMDLPYICDHQVGYSAGGYSLFPRWFLNWYIYPFFQDSLHWWVLILHKTYDHLSAAVLTVTEHFIYSHFWFFFQIGCFLQWIQSVYPHLLCSLYENGSPLFLWSPSGLLCWWIFNVPEVFLNLVYLSIFSGLAALMSADIAQNLWSLVCSSLYSYWTFHLFPLLIFFSNWLLSALNSISLPHLLCSLYDNGSPLYLWSPSGLLCWWIFIVFEVVLHLVYLSIFSGLDPLMNADIARNLWSLVCSCLNSYRTIHLFQLLIFFLNWLISALNSIYLPPFLFFYLW